MDVLTSRSLEVGQYVCGETTIFCLGGAVEWGSKKEGANGPVGDFFGGFVGAVGSGKGIGNYKAA